ncbi:hypothetical protein EMIT0357P_80005 [Pseudomonas marginalis]
MQQQPVYFYRRKSRRQTPEPLPGGAAVTADRSSHRMIYSARARSKAHSETRWGAIKTAFEAKAQAKMG